MNKQSGFTFVEVMVTIVVMGLVVGALTELYISIEHVQERTAWVQVATRAARTEVESLRNSNYNSLTAGQDIDFSAQVPTSLPAPRTGTVVVSEPQAGLKRVDVTITYSDHGTSKSVKLTSLIGVIGISQ